MKYILYILLVLAVCFILTDLPLERGSEPVSGTSEPTAIPIETTVATTEETPVTTIPETTAVVTTPPPPETTAVPETTTTAETTTVPQTEAETTATEPPMTTVPETEPPAPGEAADAVLKTAMEQLGKPYVLGANDPETGFDSSGLIYYACLQNGVDCPRYTAGQSGMGAEVSYKDLKAGDFMYLSMKPGGKISYCGIYLGDGTMLYSSTKHGKVLIINVSSPYWEQHMVTARRIG